MKAVVLTLGCKINQCESEGMAKLLSEHGYTVAFDQQDADVFVINSCAVTGEAERKSRQLVRKLSKTYPQSVLLVTGCSAQHSAEVFRALPNVVSVGGTYDKYGWIGDWLDGVEDKDRFLFDKDYVKDPLQESVRTREYVKIQDGCNRFCSYCLIPYLRGRSRSRLPSQVLEQVDRSDSKEIVLTGVDLSAYGTEIGYSLTQLLRNVKHPRVRLGSLEPCVVTSEFLEVMRDARFCKHFHLSMQSGSDRVLAAMNRHYTAKAFLEKVDMIRQVFPDANITTDYIAGFPTETEEEHLESLETVKRAKFGAIHVFPYSQREGTRAASLKQIPSAIRHRRAHEIAAVGHESRLQYLSGMIGKQETVLTEQIEAGQMTGYTSTYISTKLSADLPKNTLVRVKLKQILPDGSVMAERID